MQEHEPLSSGERTTTLDQVIDECGAFHRYQYIHFFFLSFFTIASAIVNFYYVFGGAENPYFCQVPEPITRSEVLPSQCEFLVRDSRRGNASVRPCTRWEYDRSVFGETFTSESNFVCERSLERSLLATVLQLGAMLIFFVGQVSDKIGRRRTLQMLTGLYLISSVTTQSLLQFVQLSINQKFTLLLINQFIAGVDTFVVAFILLMEITTSAHATFVANLGLITFTFGEIVVAALAYLCRHWLLLKWAITLYFLALVPYLLHMPESPYWLLSKGRYDELEELLRRMARCNGREDSRWLAVYRALVAHHRKQTDVDRGNEAKLTCATKARRFLTHVPTMSRLLITGFLGFVTLLLYFKISFNLGAMDEIDPYVNIVIGALIEASGYLVPGVLMIWFNRKPVFNLFLLFTAAYLFATPFTLELNPWLIVLIAQFGKFAISGAAGVSYIFVPELFPTSIRGTGMGFFVLASRLGSTLAPMIEAKIQHHPLLVTRMYFVYSFLTVLCILLILLLPETRNVPLADKIDYTAAPSSKTRQSTSHM